MGAAGSATALLCIAFLYQHGEAVAYGKHLEASLWLLVPSLGLSCIQDARLAQHPSHAGISTGPASQGGVS
jgi:hypothetical protein